MTTEPTLRLADLWATSHECHAPVYEWPDWWYELVASAERLRGIKRPSEAIRAEYATKPKPRHHITFAEICAAANGGYHFDPYSTKAFQPESST